MAWLTYRFEAPSPMEMASRRDSTVPGYSLSGLGGMFDVTTYGLVHMQISRTL
jgi:hypothetical protein